MTKTRIHVFAVLALAALTLTACSRSNSVDHSASTTTLTPDGQARACPAGETRDGLTYDVTIPSPLGNGETIAATVFEPSQMDCDQDYPLVLWGAGFGSPRDDGGVPTDPQNIAFNAFAPTALLRAAGYGVLSFDHRGHGESGGKIRVQDPDYEGQNVLRVVDWAEVNLDWLAYGPSADGSDPHNLRLGSVGPSYGGGYQLMLLAIDPKRRLDAVVPSVTWHDLSYSLFPGGVIKDAWVQTLAGGKEQQFDPFINAQLAQMYADNRPGDLLLQATRYHSLRYFCDGQPVATNGGPGTAPRYAPLAPPRVNALIIQSSRDTLFNLNESIANYECLRARGGDVRLFTIQAGHNTLGVAGTLGVSTVPQDPGAQFQPDPSSTSIACGGALTVDAIVAFFDEHLKGMAGRADQVLDPEHPICLNLAAGDSVHVDAVQRGGTEFTIAADAAGNTVTVGQDDSQATTVPLATVLAASEVLAGIPRLDVTLGNADDASDSTGSDNSIVFVAIGHKRLVGAGAGQWDPVDNVLTPLRGLGRHTVELSGVLERLLPGDQLGLMLYGANANQYPTTGTQLDQPHAARVKLQGTVQLPLLGALPPG